MMSDVVRTKKVAHQARPCVLMIFLPGEETHGNISAWNLLMELICFIQKQERKTTADLPPLHLIV